MADYKDIKGGTIQNFAGDPPAPIAGQVWYDSTAVAFQYRSSNPAGGWATGNNMNTARDFHTGTGVQTSALAFGGLKPPGSTVTGETESYDGASWTEVADLNTAREDHGSAGVSNTSALAIAGEPTSGKVAIAESWNGSSWTEVGDLNTARRGAECSAGTATSALCMGGDLDPGQADLVES